MRLMLRSRNPPTLSSTCFFYRIHAPPSSTLFPYTTLFRSRPSRPEASTEAQRSASRGGPGGNRRRVRRQGGVPVDRGGSCGAPRSEEHTSELQSRGHPVCRLLHEKQKHWRRHSGWLLPVHH